MAGILDIFLSAFNLFTPVFLALGVALGIGFGGYLARPKKNQVMKILPNDNRGYDFDIQEENAFSVFCKGYDTLPNQRFIKYFPSILVKKKRWFGRLSTIARYIGREGTAFTQRVMDGEVQNFPLSSTLRTLWGPEFYDKIPDEQREKLEKSKVGVTIGLTSDPLSPIHPETKKMMPSVSEEDIKREEDMDASRALWKGKLAAQKGQWINNFAWIGFGIGICFVICLLMGWIQLAG